MAPAVNCFGTEATQNRSFASGDLPSPTAQPATTSNRSTAAQQLEILTKGKEPKTVSMFLAHGSKDQAKAYRIEDTQSLFKATDALGKVFKLAE